MKVFHHNDLDGRCAAAIVHQKYPEAEYIEINYNQPFPIDSIMPNEAVYILDYSIWPDEMAKLIKISGGCNVIWIDHHKTAIERYDLYPEPIVGLRRTDRSGAWLTWEYMHPESEPPEVVLLVDDWDMWTHEKNPRGDTTRRFVAGMKIQDAAPSSGCWNRLLGAGSLSRSLRLSIVKEGGAILEYEARQSAEYIEAFGHAFRFEDHNCYACNRGIANSKLFDSVGNPAIDIFISFVWDGVKWTVTLYSKTVDVSEIAKKHGGGGHTHAAGFVCDKLPWISQKRSVPTTWA